MAANRIVVNPDGQVWPCCYLCNNAYYAKQLESQGKSEMDWWLKDSANSIMHKYFENKEELNLTQKSMEQILNHEWYQKTLPESWEKEETRLQECRDFCEYSLEEDENTGAE
jgi:hypothetical protein